MEWIAELRGGARLLHHAKRGCQEVDKCFSSETLEGTHL
jgi:hypothetical protein